MTQAEFDATMRATMTGAQSIPSLATLLAPLSPSDRQLIADELKEKGYAVDFVNAAVAMASGTGLSPPLPQQPSGSERPGSSIPWLWIGLGALGLVLLTRRS